jgi:hypothetical protein
MATERSPTPLGFEPDPYYETTEEWDFYVCYYCAGDGGDPLSDYTLPCPECGGFNG